MWLPLLLVSIATSQNLVAVTKAATRARGASARGSAPGVGECVLLCAAVCDRIDHHQGHHNLAGLVQVGQFLNSTRALARGATMHTHSGRTNSWTSWCRSSDWGLLWRVQCEVLRSKIS